MGVDESSKPAGLAAHAHLKKFGEVFAAETRHLHPKEDRDVTGRAPGEIPQAGLALSGGGIRSAAFALGVVQALEAEKCFAGFDYLSSVSGGGYTGAGLIAGLYRGDGAFPFSTTESGADLEAADVADNAAVGKIRDHSRYLMPNGIFDLVVSFGIIIRGLAVSAVDVAAVVTLCAAVMLLAKPTEASLDASFVLSVIGYWSPVLSSGLEQHLGVSFVGTKLLGLFLVGWLVAMAMVRSFIAEAERTSETAQIDPGSLLSKLTAYLLVVCTTVFILDLQGPIIRFVVKFFGTDEATNSTWDAIKYIVGALVAGTGTIGLGWKFVLSTIQEAEKDQSWNAVLKAVGGRLALYIFAALLPMLIYCLFLWLVLVGIKFVPDPLFGRVGPVWPVLLPLSLTIGVIGLQSRLGPLLATLCNKDWWKRCGFRSSDFYSGLCWTVAIIASTLAFGFFVGPGLANWDRLSSAFWLYSFVAALLSFIAVFFSENANSLHRLYRDRLQEAFNIADADRAPLKLSRLKNTANGKTLRPYPIVNGTVNLQASPENHRARDADFFVFTPDHVGSDATGYAETTEFELAERHVDLSTAIAVSGAAVSSAMGRVGIRILAPTLTLLNIRLGMWLRNPRYTKTPAARKAAEKGDWTIRYMFAETFSLLTESMKKVYVTDGGHIDNLGLHQLLKRRCQFIVVSDAEADPAMTFGAFVDVERFARIDLGVRFELQIEPIREAALNRRAALQADPTVAAQSLPVAHAAVGHILYPETTGRNPLPAKTGIILYIKASVTGDERNYLLDYERRYPKFPHEPTSDQFFSEEQFEAYRALGFHATSHALTYSDGSERWTDLLDKLRRFLLTPQALFSGRYERS